MALDTQTIKSYLISLGFEADDSSYRKFTSALSKASNEVSKHTSFMSNSWFKVGASVTAAVGTVAASTTMLVDSLGKADLGYQKYAMRMYMARDAAKQFKIVTESMGHSLEDISWLKELNQQYVLLMKEAAAMELPKEFQKQMEEVRSIKFEFTRLKVEGIYALQWVGYHLINNLISPLGKTKKSLSEINDYIRDNIPIITKKVADGLTILMRPFGDLWDIVKNLGKSAGELWNELGNEEKILLAATAIGGLFMAGGPFVKGTILLSGLIILVNDFYTAIRGGETMLPTEAWIVFAGVVDTIARGLTTIVTILNSGINLEKAVRNYTGFGITKPLAGLFGFSNLDFIPGYKKAGEYFNKESEDFLQKGRMGWGEASLLPKDLYNIWKPGSEEFEGFLGKKSMQTLLTGIKPVILEGNANSNIMETVKYASKLTGIRPDLIFGQWYGETGGFSNRGATSLNNFAGVRYPGSKEYRKYDSPAQFAEHWSSVINALYPNAKGAQSAHEYALALKQGTKGREYYEDSLLNYSRMVAGGQKQYGKYSAEKVTITNNYNINGARDPKMVAEEISKKNQANNALVYQAIGGLGG